jgi:hypothetical protein
MAWKVVVIVLLPFTKVIVETNAMQLVVFWTVRPHSHIKCTMTESYSERSAEYSIFASYISATW